MGYFSFTVASWTQVNSQHPQNHVPRTSQLSPSYRRDHIRASFLDKRLASFKYLFFHFCFQSFCLHEKLL